MLQLFMLFLVHACAAREWTPSKGRQGRQGVDHLLFMDGPWWLLWPAVLPWCCLQAVASLAWVRNATGKLIAPWLHLVVPLTSIQHDKLKLAEE